MCARRRGFSSGGRSTAQRGEAHVTAFNAVRFKVKPGREQEFSDAIRKIDANWLGLRHANII